MDIKLYCYENDIVKAHFKKSSNNKVLVIKNTNYALLTKTDTLCKIILEDKLKLNFLYFQKNHIQKVLYCNPDLSIRQIILFNIQNAYTYIKI